MDIQIRLAGVQLGPYSEKQVREYLADGLLAPTDSARAEGAETWTGVKELLDKLAQPADTALVPVQPGDTKLPKRAPDAPPGVTPFPPKIQDSKQLSTPGDVGATAKKTILIGPVAPPVPGRTGQTRSPASTSPLMPSPQGTKKVNRASLVKALAQSTSPLPTPTNVTPAPIPSPEPLAIRAPGPPLNGDSSSAKPATKSAPLPALARALAAKTVPMRNAPPLPPSQGRSPVTTPLPTKSAFKPATGPVSANSITQSLSKKLGRVSLPEESAPIPAESDLSEVKTTKLKPLVKPDEAPAVESAANPDEPSAPARPLRLFPILIYACAALAVLVAYYVWSPYHAVASLRNALNDGSADQLEGAVDFASVGNSLKAQIRKQVGPGGAPNAATSAGSSSVLSMIDNSIDVYLTPSGLSNLVKKSPPAETPDTTDVVSPDLAAKILLEFNSRLDPVKNEGLAGLDDFVVDLDVALLHFQFNGLGWKLKRIELRPGSQASSFTGELIDSTSTVISPVIDTYLERADALAQKGEWDRAIAGYTQVLGMDPQSAATYVARGSARQLKGDLDGAIADYAQALKIDPEMASAYADEGNAKAAKNDADGAIADYTQAIRLDPTVAAVYDSRGNAKITKDNLDGAISDYSQAIALDPNLASAYSDRGFARQANGNLDGAIADYTEALALKPDNAAAYYNRGLAGQSQGNLDAAILDYNRALAIDPKIAGAYFNRGNAKNASHDVDGAIADFTQALTLNPKMAIAYSDRGQARQSKGDLDGALSDFTKTLAIDPRIAVAYFDRGMIEEQKNDLDGAIADETQALDLDPKNALAYYYRGFAKLTKGNLYGAMADLRQFCDLAPTDRYADHARLYLWLISKAQNTKSDPDQELSDALQNGWNSPGEDMATKTAAFLLGRLSEADYLASASSSDAKLDQSQHCQAWYFAGMKRLLMGDKPTALDDFHKCIATGQTDYCEYILAQAELQTLTSVPPVNPVAGTVPANPLGGAVRANPVAAPVPADSATRSVRANPVATPVSTPSP